MTYPRIGCDIIHITRIQKIIESEVARSQTFHPGELALKNIERLAGIFAAKEALRKAVSVHETTWLDFEIMHEKNGKPTVRISERLRSVVDHVEISISHDGEMAFACALAFPLQKES
jgi:phosphopantetheine--protein transferase-like protein